MEKPINLNDPSLSPTDQALLSHADICNEDECSADGKPNPAVSDGLVSAEELALYLELVGNSESNWNQRSGDFNEALESLTSIPPASPLFNHAAELADSVRLLVAKQEKMNALLPQIATLEQMRMRALEQLAFDGSQIRDTWLSDADVVEARQQHNQRLTDVVNQGINEIIEALVSGRVQSVDEAFDQFANYTTLKAYENFWQMADVSFYLAPYKWVLEAHVGSREDLPVFTGEGFKQLLANRGHVDVDSLIAFSNISDQRQREEWLLNYTEGLRKNFLSLDGVPAHTIVSNLDALRHSSDPAISTKAETLYQNAIGEEAFTGLDDAVYAGLWREGEKATVPMVLAMMVAGPAGAYVEGTVAATQVTSAGRVVWSGANAAGKAGWLARGTGFAAEVPLFWAGNDAVHAMLLGGGEYFTGHGLASSFLMLGGLRVLGKAWQATGATYLAKAAKSSPNLALPLAAANKTGHLATEWGGFWGIGQFEELIGLAPSQDTTLRQELAEAGMTLVQLKLAVAAGRAVTGDMSQIKTLEIKLDTAETLFRQALESGEMTLASFDQAIREIFALRAMLTQLQNLHLQPAYAMASVGDGSKLSGSGQGRRADPADRTTQRRPTPPRFSSPEIEARYNKIAERLRDLNSTIRQAAVRALGNTIPSLSEGDRLLFVQQIAERLGDSEYRVRQTAVYALRKTIPSLSEGDRLLFVRQIAERLGDSEYRVCQTAVEALRKTIPSLSEGDRLLVVRQIAERLGDPKDDVRQPAVEALEKTISHLSEEDRLLVVQQIAERLGDAGRDVRWAAVRALGKTIPSLSEGDRLLVVQQIVKRLGDSEGDARRAAVEALKETIPSLSVGDLFRLIAFIQKNLPLNDPARFASIFAQAMFVFESIPPKAHRDFAAKNRKNLTEPQYRLYAYLYHQGPDIFELYQAFLASTDPIGDLKRLQTSAQPYRYGEEVADPSDPAQLQSAYLALDRPSARQDNFRNPPFSWNLFVERMRQTATQKLSPPFLKRGFSFSLARQVVAHETIDKGVVEGAIKRVSRGDDLAPSRRWLIDQFVSPSSANMRQLLRPYVIKTLGLDKTVDLTRPEVRQTIEASLKEDADLFKTLREVYRLLADNGVSGNGEVESVLETILLTLAWHREGVVGVRTSVTAYESALKQNKVPSELLVSTLDQLLFLYTDSVSEVLREIGGTERELSPPKLVIRMRDALKGEKDNITRVSQEAVHVEMIPSKTRADQFFGYIGEDCTKNKGKEIFKPGFQVYRMIVDGQLDGMVYVQRAEYEGKKGLIIAIAPRERLNVDQKELLKYLEAGFAKIAAEEGYDYVLISTHKAEQGNRVDMMTAIEERGHDAIPFSAGNSELFRETSYYVLYDRSKPNDDLNPVEFLEQDPKIGTWRVLGRDVTSEEQEVDPVTGMIYPLEDQE